MCRTASRTGFAAIHSQNTSKAIRCHSTFCRFGHNAIFVLASMCLSFTRVDEFLFTEFFFAEFRTFSAFQVLRSHTGSGTHGNIYIYISYASSFRRHFHYSLILYHLSIYCVATTIYLFVFECFLQHFPFRLIKYQFINLIVSQFGLLLFFGLTIHLHFCTEITLPSVSSLATSSIRR